MLMDECSESTNEKIANKSTFFHVLLVLRFSVSLLVVTCSSFANRNANACAAIENHTFVSERRATPHRNTRFHLVCWTISEMSAFHPPVNLKRIHLNMWTTVFDAMNRFKFLSNFNYFLKNANLFEFLDYSMDINFIFFANQKLFHWIFTTAFGTESMVFSILTVYSGIIHRTHYTLPNNYLHLSSAVSLSLSHAILLNFIKFDRMRYT